MCQRSNEPSILGLLGVLAGIAFVMFLIVATLKASAEEVTFEREFACKAKPEPERSACLKKYMADVKKQAERYPPPPPPPKRCTPKWIEKRAHGCYHFTKFDEMACLKGVDLDIRLCEVEALKSAGVKR